MGDVIRFTGHKRHNCDTSDRKHTDWPDTCPACILYLCVTCGGAEGSLPTHCPGYRISFEGQELIMAGQLDFKDGEWKNKLGAVVCL